ncbi:MAG: DNA repair protein RadC [Deltaproteobacteria bacterium]|nr:DNA repair protein RadC [Deltaproteobacteria bacterium]
MGKTVSHKGEGHRRRLREKFMDAGFSGFHDYEVIELLLTLGSPRKDCKDAAKAALDRFETLQAVMEASDADLCRVDGLGPKNIFGIKLIKAAADRYLQKRVIGKNPLHNSQDVFDYLNHTLRDKKRECFLSIYLDAKNKIISTDILFEGTLTASAVYPREVVQAAMQNAAAALIFAHNHPSGDPSPSPEDTALTRRLVFACHTMGITVHEHLIVGDGRFYSYADQGMIARINAEFEAV